MAYVTTTLPNNIGGIVTKRLLTLVVTTQTGGSDPRPTEGQLWPRRG